MAANPPRFFPPRYFAGNYWSGEQEAGSISASLGGSGDVTADLTYTGAVAVTGGGSKKRRRINWPFADRPIQTVPAFIEAKLGGAAIIRGQAGAIAGIAARLESGGQVEATASALAGMAGSLAGASVTQANGAAVDNWAAARDEDEFWLMAA